MNISPTAGMRTGSFGSREKPSRDGRKTGQTETETEREKLAHQVVPSHSPHSCWARSFEWQFICEYLEQTVLIGIFPRARSTNHPSFLCLPFPPCLSFIWTYPIMQCGSFKTSVTVNHSDMLWLNIRRVDFFLLTVTQWKKHVSMVSVWPEVFTKAQISDWALPPVHTLHSVLMVGYFCVGVPLFTSS